MALTEGSTSNEIVVAEDGTSRESIDRGRNRDAEVDVEVVTEELGIELGLRIHDSAVHEVTLVDEDAVQVDVAVEGALATGLPHAVEVGAVRGTSATGASKLAPELIGASSDVSNATPGGGRSAVGTGEDVAVDAVGVASLGKRDVGLATGLRASVAVSPAGQADKDAVTTGLKVSGVAVAVGDNSGNVDVVEGSGGRASTESVAIESREVATTIAKLTKEVEAEIIEVVRASL